MWVYLTVHNTHKHAKNTVHNNCINSILNVHDTENAQTRENLHNIHSIHFKWANVQLL